MRQIDSSSCRSSGPRTASAIQARTVSMCSIGSSSAMHGDTAPSGAVLHLRGAFLRRAMGAAEDLVVLLHSMTDDAASAVRAARSQALDGALEAVEQMGLAVEGHLERLVVLIAADFADR